MAIFIDNAGRTRQALGALTQFVQGLQQRRAEELPAHPVEMEGDLVDEGDLGRQHRTHPGEDVVEDVVDEPLDGGQRRALELLGGGAARHRAA